MNKNIKIPIAYKEHILKEFNGEEWVDVDNTISNISDEEKAKLDSLTYKGTKK